MNHQRLDLGMLIEIKAGTYHI